MTRREQLAEDTDALDNLVKQSRSCLGGSYMIMAEDNDLDALGRIIRHLKAEVEHDPNQLSLDLKAN